MGRYEVVDAFAKFFDGSFNTGLYATVTFKQEICMEKAKRSIRHFFKYLNGRTVYFYKKLMQCVVFFEKTDSRGGVHVHMLIKGIDPALAKTLEQRLIIAFGRSEAEPYIPGNGAAVYLANKCDQQSLLHWDKWTINSRVRKFVGMS